MRSTLFAAVLSLAAVAGCAKSDSAPPAADRANAGAPAEASVPELSVDEVDRALAAKQIEVVDCNTDRTRSTVGVIPGAILFDLGASDAQVATTLGPDKTLKYVFYCASPS